MNLCLELFHTEQTQERGYKSNSSHADTKLCIFITVKIKLIFLVSSHPQEYGVKRRPRSGHARVDSLETHILFYKEIECAGLDFSGFSIYLFI